MASRLKGGVIFSPYPSTDKNKLIAMSSGLKKDIVVRPQPDTDIEKLVSISSNLNPGVIFAPYAATHSYKLVAMSPSLKKGIVFFPPPNLLSDNKLQLMLRNLSRKASLKIGRVSIYKGSLLESCFNSLELKNAIYMSISTRAVAKKFYSSIKTFVSDVCFRNHLFWRLYRDSCRCRMDKSDWYAALRSSASVLSSYLTASDISIFIAN